MPESKYYNPDVVQQGDNPERALELVAEYCAEKGSEINTVLGETTTLHRWKDQHRTAVERPRLWSRPVSPTFSTKVGRTPASTSLTTKSPQDEHILQTAIGLYNVVTWRQFGATDPSSDNVWLMCRTIGGISLNWPKFCDEVT